MWDWEKGKGPRPSGAVGEESLADAFLGYEDIVVIVEEKLGPRVYEILGEETRRPT